MKVNPTYFHERLSCPVCSSPVGKILYDAPMTQGPVREFINSHFRNQGNIAWNILEGTDYSLAECPECCLVYQIAVPNDYTLQQIYTVMIGPSFLEKYEESLLTIDSFSKVSGELIALFKRLGKPPADTTFLDYGFGYGRWSRVARALGAKVYATEIGEDKARAASGLGVQMLSDAEVDEMRFDIVHTEQVFEHLPEPGLSFRKLAMVTDGFFKVAVPRGGKIGAVIAKLGMAHESPFARGGSMSRTDGIYAAVQPLEHLNAFAPQTMAYLAANTGFKVAGRLRQSAVLVDMSSYGGLIRLAKDLGKALVRPIIRHRSGYYIFTRKSVPEGLND